jgi:outer membrane protein OmpA-like peptidoglycan-associated protein
MLAPIAVAICLSATASFAQQSDPAVDALIRKLTPSGDVSKGPTMGVKMKLHQDTAAARMPVPAAHHAVAPARADGDGVANLTVNFENGSAELTPQAVVALDRLGAALSDAKLASYRFRVEGHTDTVGTASENLALSQQRAEAAVQYLSSKFGIPADRLQPVGMGFEELLVPTKAGVPEPRNRRVRVISESNTN